MSPDEEYQMKLETEWHTLGITFPSVSGNSLDQAARALLRMYVSHPGDWRQAHQEFADEVTRLAAEGSEWATEILEDTEDVLQALSRN